MLESKFSRTVECDEDQSLEKSGRNSKKASSNSLVKVWKSLDRRRKLKAGEIMTRSTVLPKGDDGELIPDWALQALRKQKEGSVLNAVRDNGMGDGEEQASDLEVALYLMCGSLEGPITEQAARIYFHAASRISTSLKEAMESSGIETGPLDEYDSAELNAFKRWIRKQQAKTKDKAKIRTYISTMNRSVIELENFDLLLDEQRI